MTVAPGKPAREPRVKAVVKTEANGAPAAGTTPERLRTIRKRMHMSVSALARWAGVADASVRQMEAGERSIPAAFGSWIEELGRWQEKHPPPPKSR